MEYLRYTKFDATHKVLAAIQVISDEEEEIETYRPPCEEVVDDTRNIASARASEPTVQAKLDGTVVVVTGTSTGANDSYDSELFGSSLPVKATEVILTLPTKKTGGKYRVIQNNPVLTHFQDSTNGVKGTVKNKEYTVASGTTLEYSFLVSEEVGLVDVELQDDKGNTIAKYIVADGVKFTD